jgi:transcription elongation factor S-II
MPLEPKQVEQKGRDLSKATDHKDIIKLLTDLKEGVLASEILLRSTKIGVSVNKLKQHSHPDVKNRATELVSKWRMDIARAKGASTPASGANTPRMGAKGSPLGAAGGAKESVKPKRPDVAPEKRNAVADGVDWKLTGNTVRDACLKSMYDGLSFMSEEGKCGWIKSVTVLTI